MQILLYQSLHNEIKWTMTTSLQTIIYLSFICVAFVVEAVMFIN
jgi:hypothetical protein